MRQVNVMSDAELQSEWLECERYSGDPTDDGEHKAEAQQRQLAIQAEQSRRSGSRLANERLRFTLPNIEAIRSGRKTQTRRPVKPQPTVPNEFMTIVNWGNLWATVDERQPYGGPVDDWFSFRKTQRLNVVTPDDVDTGITIEITSICIQRLNDISEADAIAEGCSRLLQFSSAIRGAYLIDARDAFRDLWAMIYGPKNQFAWERNPFVWVYQFTVE